MDESTKPRKVLIAILFTILTPGLGSLYNGNIVRFLVYIISFFSIPLIFNIVGLKEYYWAYIGLLLLQILMYLFVVVDSAIIANRSKEYVRKKYNTWYVYVGVVLLGCLLYFVNIKIADNSRYHSFEVKTDSGSPNLNNGDMIVADFGYYESVSPTYGDLVIATNSVGENLIYRVIGLPGDSIIFDNMMVRFRNKKNGVRQVSTQQFKGIEVLEFEESLPNESSHRILSVNNDAEEIDFEVPYDSYFLLCDNRLYLSDNRFWGLRKRSDIKGKMLYFLMKKG